MHDLDSLLADADPMPETRAPGATSLVGEDIYSNVLVRRPSEVDIGVPGRRRRRPAIGGTTTAWTWSARRTIVVGLVVALSVSLIVVPLAISGRGPRRVTPPAHHVTTVPTPPPTTLAPPVSHAPWPVEILAHTNIVAATAVLVPAAPSSGRPTAVMIGFESCDSMEVCSGPLERFDPQTGAFEVGPKMSAYSYLETIGSQVILFTAEASACCGPIGGWTMRTLNGATLELGPVVKLALLGDEFVESTTGVVSGTNDIWIGAGGAIFLVDLTNGKVIRRVTVPRLGGLALSPDGRTLYEVIGGPSGGEGPDALEELNASTGQVLASVRQADPNDSLGLTPVSDGVWVTTDRSVQLLSSDGLRHIALPKGAVPPDPADATSDRGFTSYDLGPFVLLEGDRGMTCLAPGTGALRAAALWTPKQYPGWLPLGVTGHTLLAIDEMGIDANGVVANAVVDVHIPAACFDPGG
jgi:hypothetical protein